MNTTPLRNLILLVVLLAGFGLSGLPTAQAAAKTSAGPALYATPEEAASALALAVKANDKAALAAIFGPQAKEFINTGDPAEDADRAAFSAAYEAKHSLEPAEKGDGRILHVGEQDWSFPVPLVKEAKSGLWFFDGKAGAEEILNRRIGRNELSVMEVCRAYVDAQNEYYRLNPEKSSIAHFARHIVSTAGKRDGLYWQTGAGEAPSPLGELLAGAAADGHAAKQGDVRPYHGYRYRVLTGQGKHAPGGAYSYDEGGVMFGGFALIAQPDVWGVSGVMTFVVNQDGVIYEKNLGKDTPALAQKITVFDPDETWHKVDDTE